ncbi:MAG: glycoside hydrolase family 32 protein [Chloroflexota bacterium]|nr:glycoside hydrolase family 32 protein [Chloroflexota bacterium]
MTQSQGSTRQQDHHRPSYHFLPAANWMNDPNGVIQWKGRYHLFYQYNPDGAYHANMHWGHAVSDDLAHWRELPIAIAPSPDSPDQGGIFSGCVVDKDGRPVAVYTGVNDDYSVQTQCLALGNDDLTEWQKHPRNPVVGDVPTHLGQSHDFRDPFVWREGDQWYMTLSAHIVGVGGAVLLYRSADLVEWEYLGPLYVGERARSGRNFECANFFRLGDKWLLIISVQWDHAPTNTIYLVGRLEEGRFIPEFEGVYDAGYSYASLMHVDESGRPLIYSWIREGRGVHQQRAAGWSGVQAIPRVLSLDSQNRLVSRPVPEIEELRGRRHRFGPSDIAAGDLPVRGLALDIEAQFDVSAAGTCGIELAVAPDGEEKAAIVYERDTGTLRIQRHYREDAPEVDSAPQGLPHRPDAGDMLQLRILLDGSVLEVIADGRSRVTSRIYPSSAENRGLRILAPTALRGLDIWEMASIW